MAEKDWYQFCILVYQRPLWMKCSPMLNTRHMTREDFKQLSKEEQDEIRAKFAAFGEGFLRAVHDMPTPLLWILR